jgi:tetratricopeptide (TPR) repeat protein
VRDSQGRYREAVSYQRRGLVHLHMQAYEEAAGYYGQAVTALDELGESRGAAIARVGLARALTAMGRHDEALRLAQD